MDKKFNGWPIKSEQLQMRKNEFDENNFADAIELRFKSNAKYCHGIAYLMFGIN